MYYIEEIVVQEKLANKFDDQIFLLAFLYSKNILLQTS